MSPPIPDLMVVGGGVIGLSCAWRLAQEGWRVEVVDGGPLDGGHLDGKDRGTGHQESASWAAAGMLAPLAEAEAAGPFFEACRASRDLWQSWAETLHEASSIELDYDRSGSIYLGLGDDHQLEKLARLAQQVGEPTETLSRQDLRHHLPDLALQIDRGLLLTGEHRVNNRQVVRALLKALEHLQVRLTPHRRIHRVESSTAGVRVSGDDGTWQRTVPRVLIAAGAWSGRIAGLPALPVEPVRGQMIRLSQVEWPWQGCVRTPHFYGVRRQGGDLLLGATVEHVGFDNCVTPQGLSDLLAFCRQLFPSLDNKPVAEIWSGLRPGSTDQKPILGPLEDHVWVATGHFRNGILLAPWTAEIIAQQLQGPQSDQTNHDPSELLWSGFHPRRFTARSFGDVIRA